MYVIRMSRPTMSTAIPIGSELRIHALPCQSGPTQSVASNWKLSPGASVRMSQIRARRQSSCALNQISTDEHSRPPFWMYITVFRPALSAYRSGT